MARVAAAVLAIAAALWLSPAALAAPTLTMSPGAGPPGTTLRISGSGFSAFALVDVFLDADDVALVATDAAGAFSGITFRVPRTAVPGAHWVTVSGRPSGPAVQKSFVVRTDWASFGFSATRS